MNSIRVLLLVAALAVVPGQEPPKAAVTNLETAKWSHDKGDPPGSEGVMLHANESTGALDLLVRFPAGHVIKPHFHESNERIVVVEGQLTLRNEAGASSINASGFAFLPAREVQRLSC